MHWTYFRPDVTASNFPANGKGSSETTIELVSLGRAVSTIEAARKLAVRGLELPDMHDQLSFATQHPDAWVGKLIVFLGSVWAPCGGDRVVGVLNGWNGERCCGLGSGRWPSDCLFAGVRK